MTTATGSFRLVIVLGKAEIPAHPGRISRDAARRMQRIYRVGRPEAVTRVRKAVG